ncbi:hypothetical protein BDW22DRAFT_1430407 [Trametopsis cervina]|nr:hypothetical protein BDW22DRAFT_1430407 [Trametopsis cervina]
MDEIQSEILALLRSHKCSFSTVLLGILHKSNITHPLVDDMLRHSREILSAWRHHPLALTVTKNWVSETAAEFLTEEVHVLSLPQSGWNFSAGRTEPYQLQEFDLAETATGIRAIAPFLWDTLD